MAEGVDPPAPQPGGSGPPDPTASIEEFLDHAIDRFLRADVRELKKITVPQGETGTGSYLIVFAILVGCELLGRLAGEPKHNAVAYFWHKYMPVNYREHGDLARALLRNYVAHAYSLPPGLFVLRGGPPGWHLHRDQNGNVYIDCLELADDFERIYPGARNDILGDGPMSRRQYCEIVAGADKDRADFAEKIETLPLIEPKHGSPPDASRLTRSGGWMHPGSTPPGASDSPMRWRPERDPDPGPGTPSAFRYPFEPRGE
jgi:hypothetical protein